jgi:hypothetical protein
MRGYTTSAYLNGNSLNHKNKSGVEVHNTFLRTEFKLSITIKILVSINLKLTYLYSRFLTFRKLYSRNELLDLKKLSLISTESDFIPILLEIFMIFSHQQSIDHRCDLCMRMWFKITSLYDLLLNTIYDGSPNWTHCNESQF